MPLITRAPQATHYIMTRLYGGLEPGMHVRLVGEPPEWLIRCARQTDEPFPADPAEIFPVDTIRQAEDDAMIAATMAETARPTRWLTSAELQLKVPAMTNPVSFDLACSQFGFPAPARIGGAAGDGFCWSEKLVNQWLAGMRARLEQLRTLIG
jgi:hypothetical protein